MVAFSGKVVDPDPDKSVHRAQHEQVPGVGDCGKVPGDPPLDPANTR